MPENPLVIHGRCIIGDDELYAHMRSALERGLPELTEFAPETRTPVLVVGSGPSVATQLETIRQMKGSGAILCAVKDAHDWLISQNIVPDYALALDPQEHRWNCFTKKRDDVHYLIASQCHASMFEHLKDCRVTLWHLRFKADQNFPTGRRLLIPGGSTSGLRALTVLFTLGYRDFHLFGFDSCLSGDQLRVDGSGKKPEERITELRITGSDEVFYCNGSMALQAQNFQDCYDMLPGSTFTAYGAGLIPAIIRQREKDKQILDAETKQPDNGRVSFIHKMDANSASFRYRAQIPASVLGASLNDLSASTLVFCKPEMQELMQMAVAKRRGQRVIVDFCDDHFQWGFYQEALWLADAITCPTEVMREKIQALGRDATVIPDPWEYPLEPPHCQGVNILWFGHHVNRLTLQRVLPDLEGYPLHVVGNFDGAIPWSHETMLQQFAGADIVILPATEEYKSANRAVESIRQGCFVVAEPHPAWNDIPGIWIGNIKDGIEWTGASCTEANQRLLAAQSYVTERYSPARVASAWKSVIQSPTTSEAAIPAGLVGSALT
jgi:hypothetical protein